MIRLRHNKWWVYSMYKGHTRVYASFEYLYEAMKFEDDHMAELDRKFAEKVDRLLKRGFIYG